MKQTGAPKVTDPKLSGVAETLLIPLYVRAIESQLPDALLKDKRAVALVSHMPDAFARVRQIKMDEEDRVALILRNREFDRSARSFLARHPGAVVVHIGCGLDARFERVDDGHVRWYDLDLPDVIELRRKFIGGEGVRHIPPLARVMGIFHYQLGLPINSQSGVATERRQKCQQN